VGGAGAVQIGGITGNLFNSPTAATTLRSIVTSSNTHLFANEISTIVNRSINAQQSFQTAFAASTVPNPTPYFQPSSGNNQNNGLAQQLQTVARVIGARSALGAQRQIFFVSMGGFDTHDGLASVHPGLLSTVADALTAFHQSTIELGVASQVTTFTASDFGRTLTADDGSDHGWGSMHFMLGGAVNGGRYYGTAPVVANNGPDDVGQGRLLPSTGVDQYAATLGKWFGISDTDLLTVLPNLGNYDPSQRNLGFV